MKAMQSDLSAIRTMVDEVEKASGEALSRSRAKSEIVIHAMEVFSEQGLQKTTVQDLLDASDVSRRTFYKYFQNKNQVLEYIYRIFCESILLHFRERVSGNSSLQQVIRDTVDLYFDYHLSVGPVMLMLLDESRSVDSVLAEQRERVQGLLAAVLAQELSKLSGKTLSVELMRSLIWVAESYPDYIFSDSDGVEARLKACRDALVQLAEGAIAG